jgi:hypothetical protein
MSQYPLRLPDYIMEQAKAAAAEENVSINQMFLSLIAEGMGHRRALKGLQERAARGDPQKALALLDRLPSLPLESGDDMPDTDR